MYVRQAVGLVELRAWQCLSVWKSNSETSRVDQRGLGKRLALLGWARRCMCFWVPQRGPRMHNHEYVRAAMMS